MTAKNAFASRARRQGGFTLVELVTVILILGVLAAVALPRYADLQGQARAAKVKGVMGSIKAASAMVKATALANGKACSTATGDSVSLEGTSVDLNYCYAQALGGASAFTTGILGAANVSASDSWVVDTTNTGGNTGGSTLQINLSDAATPATCSISYKSATSATVPPVITANVTGC